jgi:hypothetical protein
MSVLVPLTLESVCTFHDRRELKAMLIACHWFEVFTSSSIDLKYKFFTTCIDHPELGHARGIVRDRQ